MGDTMTEIPLYSDDWSARIYDAHVGERGYASDLPLWLDMAKEAGSSVLELGVGTGRLALPLAEAGFDVTGLDSSAGMLAVAGRKRAAAPPEVQARLALVAGDMSRFELGVTFGLITIPAAAFQALMTREDQRACLECCRQHLQPGGRLAMVVFNPRLDWLIHPGGVDLEPEEMTGPEGERVVFTCHTDYQLAEQTLSSHWLYRTTVADGAVIDRPYLVRLRYLFRYEIEWMLEGCGLAVEGVYGLGRQPLTADSPWMIPIARKPRGSHA